MEKVVVLFVISLLMITPVSAATVDPGILPDSPLHTLDMAVDDARLAIRSGESKAKIAMQIKKERLVETQFLIQQGIVVDVEDVESAILDARKKAKVIQKEVTPDIKEEVDEDVEESVEIISDIKEELPASGIEGFEDIEVLLNQQMTEEEKAKLAGELAEKIGNLCESLSKQDYDLMLKEPKCNPDKAPDWLKDKIKDEIKERQDRAVKEAVDQIAACFEDPRTCDCSRIPVKKEQQNCEKGKALAIRCEFKQEMDACEQLDAIDKEMLAGMPAFMRPFISDTIQKLKAKKEKEMFAKFAPPECVEAGATTREECERVMIDIRTPPECKEREAFTEQECKAVMEEIYGPPPEECMRDGEFIGDKECEKIMEKMAPEVGFPPPCMEAGATTPEECDKVLKELEEEVCEGISEEECRKKREEIMGPPEILLPKEELLPEECAGLTREGCEAIIGEIPIEEVIEVEEDLCKGLSPEDCEKLYEDIYIEEFPEEIEIPEEEEIAEEICIDLTPAECEAKMKEKFGIVEEEEAYKVPREMADENERILLTPEGVAQIDEEVIDRIIENSERIASEEIKHPEEAVEINDKIKEIEEKREELESIPEEELAEVARQIEERVKERVPEEIREERPEERKIPEIPEEVREKRPEEREERREEPEEIEKPEPMGAPEEREEIERKEPEPEPEPPAETPPEEVG